MACVTLLHMSQLGPTREKEIREWLVSLLNKKTIKAIVIRALAKERGYGWMSIHTVARSLGINVIRTSFGERKYIYWTLTQAPKRRWICCQFTPIDAIHFDWAEEILDKLGYQEISCRSKEIPDIGEWFIREGKYYWTEEGPCPRGWRTEDPGEDESN